MFPVGEFLEGSIKWLRRVSIEIFYQFIFAIKKLDCFAMRVQLLNSLMILFFKMSQEKRILISAVAKSGICLNCMCRYSGEKCGQFQALFFL